MKDEPTIEEVEVATYRALSSDDGKTFMHYLVHRFGFEHKTTLELNSFAKTAYNEGQRTLVKHILSLYVRGRDKVTGGA